MRRLLTLALPAILATSMLAACGGDDSDNSASSNGLSAETTDEPTTTTAADDGGMGEMNHDEAPDPVAPDAREIDVEAESFEFGPTEIQARAGEDLAIAFTADDVEHDFVIDELGTHISAAPGETTEGGLRVDEPGNYTFYCSVSGHREAGMEGTLRVS